MRHLWVVYADARDWECGPDHPEAVFADPVDAMMWADDEYEIGKNCEWSVNDEGDFERFQKGHYGSQCAVVVVAAIPFFPFECPAYIYGGPGHQSKHTCELEYPHEIEDEHSDSYYYEWTGTGGFS